ncbi:DUF488 domain-containing protein [Pseudomonas sp. RIT-PI-AD]|uniref:DUF488 domain-containing protein n=1 Tax=Pseudomonas sp. RIT-PI-AD TaxID=3035294 RepID=UPI0021D94927|nr:DUF488 domain-containing protein [Pseudomonas sp. RIT-PI-AD]
MSSPNPPPLRLWTLGHSTLPIEVFLALLTPYGVQGVADVRRFPSSKRYPQFGEGPLRAALAAQGIDYRWLPELGGRREPTADSPNTAWRNPAFRGYADHLDSAEFARGLDKLLAFASARRVAVMCAERMWTQCHRALIADVLHFRGHEVLHILDDQRCQPHAYGPQARIVEGRLSYGADPRFQAHQGDLFAPE